jgi:hypothetical protein
VAELTDNLQPLLHLSDFYLQPTTRGREIGRNDADTDLTALRVRPANGSSERPLSRHNNSQTFEIGKIQYKPFLEASPLSCPWHLDLMSFNLGDWEAS